MELPEMELVLGYGMSWPGTWVTCPGYGSAWPGFRLAWPGYGGGDPGYGVLCPGCALVCPGYGGPGMAEADVLVCVGVGVRYHGSAVGVENCCTDCWSAAAARGAWWDAARMVQASRAT